MMVMVVAVRFFDLLFVMLHIVPVVVVVIDVVLVVVLHLIYLPPSSCQGNCGE